MNSNGFKTLLSISDKSVNCAYDVEAWSFVFVWIKRLLTVRSFSRLEEANWREKPRWRCAHCSDWYPMELVTFGDNCGLICVGLIARNRCSSSELDLSDF